MYYICLIMMWQHDFASEFQNNSINIYYKYDMIHINSFKARSQPKQVTYNYIEGEKKSDNP